MFNNFDELYASYGLKNSSGILESFSREKYREYINDCFDTYEHIGFCDTFVSPYENEEKHNNKKFTVIGRVSECTDTNQSDGADLECLPMWYIQFEDGEKMAAYPEEICKEEQRRSNA